MFEVRNEDRRRVLRGWVSREVNQEYVDRDTNSSLARKRMCGCQADKSGRLLYTMGAYMLLASNGAGRRNEIELHSINITATCLQGHNSVNLFASWHAQLRRLRSGNLSRLVSYLSPYTPPGTCRGFRLSLDADPLTE